ncbi:MAG: DUF4446 family protein [Firmicutes bacterium]|nr:DUF4446 family protein [Bacillota bacterium]
MPSWELMGEWLEQNAGILWLAMGGVVLICIALAAASLALGLALKKRYYKFMMGLDGLDLEGLLSRHGELIEEGQRWQQQAVQRLDEIEKKLQLAVAGVGMVRYNAFQDTGSDLSFSMALLDRNLDGVIVTSLYGREECRSYGKIVKKGQPLHYLSEEEKQALEEAKRRVEEGKARRRKR